MKIIESNLLSIIEGWYSNLYVELDNADISSCKDDLRRSIDGYRFKSGARSEVRRSIARGLDRKLKRVSISLDWAGGNGYCMDDGKGEEEEKENEREKPTALWIGFSSMFEMVLSCWTRPAREWDHRTESSSSMIFSCMTHESDKEQDLSAVGGVLIFCFIIHLTIHFRIYETCPWVWRSTMCILHAWY